jgi:hypothetical protein
VRFENKKYFLLCTLKNYLVYKNIVVVVVNLGVVGLAPGRRGTQFFSCSQKKIKFRRLYRAIYEEQKEFVAHSYCQLLLHQRWTGETCRIRYIHFYVGFQSSGPLIASA